MQTQSLLDKRDAAVGKEYDCPQGCGWFVLGERSCLVGVLGGSHHPDFPHHCHENDSRVEPLNLNADNDNSPSDR